MISKISNDPIRACLITLLAVPLVLFVTLAIANAQMPGFSFQPPEGWKTAGIENNEYDLYGSVEEIYYYLDSTEQQLLSIASINYSNNIKSANDYINILKNEYDSSNANFVNIIHKNSDQFISNKTVEYTVFELFAAYDNDVIYRDLYAIIERPSEDRLIAWRYQSDIENFDKHLPVAIGVLESLEIDTPAYSSKEFEFEGINVTSPVGWIVEPPRKIEDDDLGNASEVAFYSSDLSSGDLTDFTIISITSVPYKNEIRDLDSYLHIQRNAFKKEFQNFKIIPSLSYLQDNLYEDARQFDVFGFYEDGNDARNIFIVFDRPQEKRLVVFNFSASMERYNEYLPIAKEVLASLQIAPPTKAVSIATWEAEPRQGQTGKALIIDQPIALSPDEVPADINDAILAIVKTIRGEISDGPVSNRNTAKNFGLDDVAYFRRASVIGYRLNVVLENPENEIGRRIAGRIFFQDEYQLGATIEFAATYSGVTDGNSQPKSRLDTVFAQLVTPDNPRVMTFLVKASDMEGGQPLESMEQFIRYIAPRAIMPNRLSSEIEGIRSYLVISVFLDKMPSEEDVDMRIAYEVNGVAYPPAWTLKRNYGGWWLVAGSEYMNLTKGPVKYFILYHTKKASPPNLVYAFTPIGGGRQLITEDMADIYPDKEPVSWKLAFDLTERGDLGMALNSDGEVTDVFPDYPAAKAGIRKGDNVWAINGVPIYGDVADILSKSQVMIGRKTEIIYKPKNDSEPKVVFVMPVAQ
jgi:hypothetical protein